MPMLSLALRNVFRQRTRTTMTLAAIVFGVSGLVLSGGFVQDIYFQLGELLIHSQSGHLQIARKGYFDAGAKSPEKYLMEDTQSTRSAIGTMPAVDDFMGRIHFAGLLNNGRTDWAILGEGVEPEKEAQLGTNLRIVAGRQLTSKDAYGALIGQGVAKALKVAPGDPVTLMVNAKDGSLNSLEFEIVGIFQSFSKDYDARAVRIPLQSGQELLINKGINTLIVSLTRTQDTARATHLLQQKLATSLEVRTWKQLNDFYDKTVQLYDRQFGVLQLIILLMVLLSVSNSVNMSIFERTGEFGTMRAVGNPDKVVFRLIMVESVLLGLIGSLLGTAVGILLALAISAIGIPMPPPPNSELGFTASIRVVPHVIAMAFFIGTAATFLAALPPALRVARTPIVDALRQNI
jgi:putative ABC transport system permease protein